MRIHNSPLRYPGGKTKLIAYVLETLKINNLIGGTYIEPFAGGAGIAWYLLLNEKVKDVCINDLNGSVYAFWYCVLNETKELTRLINDTPVTIDEWHKQKEIQDDLNSTIIELGFSTFFLNRTNRSGIIKGGVMGGKNQDGRYKLDCRYNKLKSIKKIKSIANLKERITLTNKDARDFLKDDLKNIGSKCLINIDPPYYEKGKGLYQNFFEHDDHCELSDIIRSLDKPWIVTYDDSPAIKGIYNEYTPLSFGLSYTAQVKRKGSEVIIHSPLLDKCGFDPNLSFDDIKKIKRAQGRIEI
ncbi:DNA adenine methylase [Marinomonas sp. 5E14-1]|uniref:DNA adenine methylase n=1 Tax=Marinomonas sp. 5E14-1 TaxID=3153922 RepID=UPI0032633FD5